MRAWLHLVPVSILLILTLITFRPLLSSPATRITDPADAVLGAWTIRNVQDNMLASRSLFDGNIFASHKHTLVFSDTFVPSALLSFPLRMVTREPLVLFNFSLILSAFLTALSLYWLILTIRRADSASLRGKILLALTISIVFSWSQAHLHYAAHLHMFALQYVILAIGGLVTFHKTGAGKWLVFTAACTALQAWQSIFLAYGIMLVALGFLLDRQFRTLLRSQWRWVIGSVILFFVTISPIVFAYVQFYQTYHAIRDIREAIHFSLIPKDIVGKFWSPAVYLVLILTGALSLRKKKQDRLTSIFLFCFLGFFLLSVGPVLHLTEQTVKLQLMGKTVHVPLPYAIFYYLVPGFQAFRTPSRFFPLALLLGLLWAMRILHPRLEKSSVLFIVCGLLIALTIIIVPTIPVFSIPSISQYPTYTQWLKSKPEQVVLSLPMYDWMDPKMPKDHLRMLYSLEAGKSIVNGQSGFYPPNYIDLLKIMRTFPDEKSLLILTTGVADFVIVDKEAFTPQQLTQIKSEGLIAFEDSQVIILKTPIQQFP